MRVEERVVVWCSPDTADAIRAAGVGANIRLEFMSDEQDVWAAMPPRGNPRLYLLEAELANNASAGFVAAVAARPSSWPPIVVFSADHGQLAASPLWPNSRVNTGEDLAGSLGACITYWVRHNESLLME